MTNEKWCAYLLVFRVPVCGSPALVLHHPLVNWGRLVSVPLDWVVQLSSSLFCETLMSNHFRSLDLSELFCKRKGQYKSIIGSQFTLSVRFWSLNLPWQVAFANFIYFGLCLEFFLMRREKKNQTINLSSISSIYHIY